VPKQTKEKKNVEKDERFKRIYQKYQRRIYWYIYKKVSQPQKAEDLVADVFLKLYEKWDDVADRQQKGIVSWIYTVARNASIDALRKSQTRDKRPIENEEIDPATKVFENFVGEAMKEERLAHINEAMKTISDLEKEVIALRFEEDLKFGDIAEIINKKEGACKMMFYRSLKKLRKELNKIYSNKQKANGEGKQKEQKEK
jgi:RNA polymerase sigma-70 factor (ECF subfamily)